jgi:hypothetical protein
MRGSPLNIMNDVDRSVMGYILILKIPASLISQTGLASCTVLLTHFTDH